eukprot:Nitzschia sp. Nitz4//scaffold425_size8350//2608//3711//NITZ4_009124-RA/size8350-processed-gene-0.5-mRNA-1//-1//CDS//3329551605//4569//frame0
MHPTTTILWFTLFLLPLLSYVIHISISSNPQQQLQQAKDAVPLGNGAMFDSLAHRYDWVNAIMALGMDSSWRLALTQQLKQQMHENFVNTDTNINDDHHPVYSLLDMATGTGEVALQLSRTFSPSSIWAVDPSILMLQQAQQKVSTLLEPNLASNIHFVQADAQDLQSWNAITTDRTTTGSGSDGGSGSSRHNLLYSMDGATMAFGIRNIPQRSQALCEIHTLLKPNQGVLAIMEFSEPDPQQFGVMGWLARWFIRYVIPVVGGVMSWGHLEEYMYLQRSIQDFPSPQGFVSLLESLECPTTTSYAASGSGSDTTSGDAWDETKSATVMERGYYEVHSIHHLNFGSVQIYTMTARTDVDTQQKTSYE